MRRPWPALFLLIATACCLTLLVGCGPAASDDESHFVLGDLIGRSEIKGSSSTGGKVRFEVEEGHGVEVGDAITVKEHTAKVEGKEEGEEIYKGSHQVTAVTPTSIDTATPFTKAGAGGGVWGKPFKAPSLADVQKSHQWKDMPVEDSLVLLRERLKKEPPQVSVEEALKLKNDTPEDNTKILSALGQLPIKDEDVQWEAQIIRHEPADIKSMNPILASSTAEFDVTGLTTFALFAFDWNFKRFAAKEAVDSWQQSTDRMVDLVKIRKDLLWSDGKPITAHDVVFSFKAIMSSKVPVPAQRSGTDKLRWVEAYDDHTVAFFHKRPLAINHWNVQFSILPKHIYEKSISEDPLLVDSDYHAKLEDQPVTGGPYIVERRVRNQEIVLRARENFYIFEGKQVRDRPYFKTVRFRIITEPSVALLALKAGDIDDKILNPEEWRTKTNDDDFYRFNTKSYGTEWVNFQFNWNCKSPFFNDARVRRAMSLAFDHQELIEKLRFGLDEPCRGIFHPASAYCPKDPPKTDYNTRNIAEAERLLTEAGWADSDNDGFRDKEIDGKRVKFDFTILTSNRQDRIDICTLLKRNLAQIGINCYVSPLEFTVLQDKLIKHQFQASFGGWGTGAYPDTSENIWKTGEGRNFGEYSNPEVDRLFDEAAKTLDDDKRNAMFQQIHRLLYDDQPYTWLYYQNAYYGFNKKLRGYVYSPRGPYNYGPGFSSIWTPAAAK